MKISVIFICLNFFILNFSLAQEENAIQFKNKILSFKDIQHDFVNKDTIVVEYTFQNVGTVPVRILGVDSSCTCTTPSYSQGDIKPGETGKIVLSTTKSQLRISNSVYAVIMASTTKRYYKIVLKWE